MRALDIVPFWTSPSAPFNEASRLLFDVASTPPMSGGEWHGQSIHTFFDPSTHITWTGSLKRRGLAWRHSTSDKRNYFGQLCLVPEGRCRRFALFGQATLTALWRR